MRPFWPDHELRILEALFLALGIAVAILHGLDRRAHHAVGVDVPQLDPLDDVGASDVLAQVVMKREPHPAIGALRQRWRSRSRAGAPHLDPLSCCLAHRHRAGAIAAMLDARLPGPGATAQIALAAQVGLHPLADDQQPRDRVRAEQLVRLPQRRAVVRQRVAEDALCPGLPGAVPSHDEELRRLLRRAAGEQDRVAQVSRRRLPDDVHLHGVARAGAGVQKAARGHAAGAATIDFSGRAPL